MKLWVSKSIPVRILLQRPPADPNRIIKFKWLPSRSSRPLVEVDYSVGISGHILQERVGSRWVKHDHDLFGSIVQTLGDVTQPSLGATSYSRWSRSITITEWTGLLKNDHELKDVKARRMSRSYNFRSNTTGWGLRSSSCICRGPWTAAGSGCVVESLGEPSHLGHRGVWRTWGGRETEGGDRKSIQ